MLRLQLAGGQSHLDVVSDGRNRTQRLAQIVASSRTIADAGDSSAISATGCALNIMPAFCRRKRSQQGIAL